MTVWRILGSKSKSATKAEANQWRNLLFQSSMASPHIHFSPLSNSFHSLPHKALPLHHGLCNIMASSHYKMSTSTSPDKHGGTSVENKGTNENTNGSNEPVETATVDVKDSQETHQTSAAAESQSTSQNIKRRRRAAKRTAFSDSDSDQDLDDLSKEDLVKLVLEKEQLLEKKQKEFSEWNDKLMRNYAEMENVMERTRRDAENSKKFAVQSFAKSLLDVADNLSRASSVTKESFNKIDTSNETVGAVPILKTLLEGVELTEKQFAEVFRKVGIEKYDPTDEQFDPNRHNAVFQVPDNSKPPGTVAVVLKAGYTLHDRIIRPAEVGVTVATENNEPKS